MPGDNSIESDKEKICFIDIDGVMVPSGKNRFSAKAVEAVQKLRDAGFKFVLSSTDRMDIYSATRDAREFVRNGLTLSLAFSSTPSKMKFAEDWLDGYYGPVWPKTVIMLDDYPVLGNDAIRVVQVDSSVGLTVDDVKEWVR